MTTERKRGWATDGSVLARANRPEAPPTMAEVDEAISISRGAWLAFSAHSGNHALQDEIYKDGMEADATLRALFARAIERPATPARLAWWRGKGGAVADPAALMEWLRCTECQSVPTTMALDLCSELVAAIERPAVDVGAFEVALEKVVALDSWNDRDEAASGLLAMFTAAINPSRTSNSSPEHREHWHAFGCLVWKWLADHWDGEDGWDIAQMAVEAGLAERVKYDPAIHEGNILLDFDVEPGDEITYPLKGDPAFVSFATLRAELTAAIEARERAEVEEDDTHKLNCRLSDLLHGVANAVHGRPLENGFWSFHDLPELTNALRERAEKAEAERDENDRLMSVLREEWTKDLRAELAKVTAERDALRVECDAEMAPVSVTGMLQAELAALRKERDRLRVALEEIAKYDTSKFNTLRGATGYARAALAPPSQDAK